ncbi:MAG TPA: hypothetical protein VF868_07410 [Bacteroidia bacterium]|jgi:hypothetical protein
MRKLFLLILFLSPFGIKACECPPLELISKDLCSQYDVIFYGRVDSIIPCNTKGIGTAYFTVINLYKGSAQKQIILDYDCTSSCMMSFAKDEEWIIYSMYQHFDLLTVNLCGHSRKKPAKGSVDFYQAASQRSFEEENEFLKNSMGLQGFASVNKLNEQQKELQPHNVQPSALNKLWLLLASLVVMAGIYLISKKYFRNGK